MQALYEYFYADEPFVDVLPAGVFPQTRTVQGRQSLPAGGECAPGRGYGGGDVDIDNLVKGASGQAIQNMNIMLGLPEDMGLKQVGLLP